MCPSEEKPRRRLLFFHELPSVLRFNEFIRSGYRAGYTYPAALRSIFEVHNETGNIWTHLIPAILLIYALLGHHTFPESAIWTHITHTVPAVICLLASVSYHTCLACHHHYYLWIRIDVCAIYSLLLGSQLQIFAYSFPCHPNLWRCVTGLYFIFGGIGLYRSLHGTTPITRAMPMLPLVLIRVFVLFARLIVGIENMQGWKFYLLAESISFLGGLINSLRFPEKWFKPRKKNGVPYEVGYFDYCMSSHQIMHVLVAVAILLMRHGLKSDCQYASTHSFVCPTD